MNCLNQRFHAETISALSIRILCALAPLASAGCASLIRYASTSAIGHGGSWHDPDLEAKFEKVFAEREQLEVMEGFWQSRNEYGEAVAVFYKTDPKENDGFSYAMRSIREVRTRPLPHPLLKGEIGGRWNPSPEPNMYRGQVLLSRPPSRFWTDATARLLDPTTLEIAVHHSGPMLGGNVQRAYLIGPERELRARLDAAASGEPARNKRRVSGGSGFLISDSLVVTNHHVVFDSDSIRCFIEDMSYEARIIAKDQSNDLALLAIQDRPQGKHVFLTIGDASSARQGQSVYAMGFPLTDLLGSQMRVHSGIISALTGYEGRSSQFQLEMTLNPGNSGGPVLDQNGQVIGIVTSKLGLGLTGDGKIRIPEGIVFAVKSDAIRPLLAASGNTDALKSANEVEKDYSAEDVAREVGRAVVRIESEAKSRN